MTASPAFLWTLRPGCLLLLTALAGCGDDDGLTGGVPTELQLEFDAASADAQAGELLPEPVLVRVLDDRGEGVAGETVALSVEAGGGEVDESGVVTDDAGEAPITGWRMGPSPGTNRLRISVAGVEPRTVEVEAGPGPPEEVTFQETELGELPVATILSDLPAVRVRDRFGTPIAGLEVEFTPSEGGSVASATSMTDQDGTTETPDWTLGPAAGPQALEATTPGVAPATLSVTAVAGPPELVGFDTPPAQRVEVGLFVPHPPVVLVTDAHGNGIPDLEVEVSVVAGGGSIGPAEDRTDETGRARVERWTMGPAPGENRLEARVDGLPPAFLSAEGVPEDAEPVGRYFRVGAVHVNQGNQTREGDIPLVRGRGGLLRAWVVSSEEGAPFPAARVRVSSGGDVLVDELVPPPAPEAPTAVAENAQTPSWYVPLEGAWIDDDLQVEVEVDPHHEVGVVTRRFRHWPAEGEDGGFTTVALDAVRIRMVALEDDASGERGQLDQDNLDHFSGQVPRMLPVGETAVTLGEPLVVDLFDNEGLLRVVLPEMLAAWAASDFRDHYFHGIFPHQGAAGFSGAALISQDPAEPRPVAMTYDLVNAGNFAVVRGLGHNMGRAFAPCGSVPGPVDPDYPHEGGIVGPIGYDPVGGELRGPQTHHDVMSFCSPFWISDYNFRATLEWTQSVVWPTSEGAEGAAPGGPEGSGPGLLVWGSVDGSGATLEPAFPVDARPLLPTRGGPYRVRGLEADGTELFAFDFPAAPGTGGAAEAGAFAWVVPLPASARERVRRLELHGPGTAVSRTSGVEATARDADGAQPAAWRDTGRAAGRALVWDAEVFPAALVRSRDTGHVVGILRSGRMEPSRWAGEVEVVLSDGVRGWTVTAEGLGHAR